VVVVVGVTTGAVCFVDVVVGTTTAAFVVVVVVEPEPDPEEPSMKDHSP